MADHNGNAQGAIFRQASFVSSSSDDDDPDEKEGRLDADSCVNATSSDEQSNESGSNNESISSDKEGDDNDSGNDDDDGDKEDTEGTTTTSPASSSSGSGAASFLGKRCRRRFTASWKIRLVKFIEKKMQSDNISQRAAAKHYNINAKQAREWKELFSQLNDQKHNKKAKSLCNSRASILDLIGEDLLRYIFELRERGMGVSL